MSCCDFDAKYMDRERTDECELEKLEKVSWRKWTLNQFFKRSGEGDDIKIGGERKNSR